MNTVFRFLMRLVLVVAALVFALSLLLALLVVLALWGLRALWAKLTGRPVVPFVMRFDPRGGFGRVYRGAQYGSSHSGVSTPTTGPSRRPVIGDVTDVEPKERP